MPKRPGLVAFGQIGNARTMHLEVLPGWTLCDRPTEDARNVLMASLYRLCPRCRKRAPRGTLSWLRS